MKAKILLLLLLVTDIIIEVNAQTITSDITVCFYESDTLTPLFANQDSIHVSVEEILSISDWSWDSIELSLEKPHWLAPLMPHMFFSDIQVFTRKSSKDNWEQIHYEYLFPRIKFIVPTPNCHIKITYSHLPYSMMLHWYNLPHFNAILNSDGEWYFTHPLMYVKSIQISAPSTGYTLFLNKPSLSINSNTNQINLSKSEENDISVILIKNHWYQKQGYSHERYQLNMFHWDSTYYLYAIDTIRMHVPISKTTMGNRMEKIKMTMMRYCNFFPKQKFLTINIVDNCLETNDIIWGCAFQEENWDTLSVFFETNTGWYGNVAQHEILHGYLDILPPKDDSTYFLFCESLTEYLSVALFNTQDVSDSIFSSRYTHYVDNRKESDGENIFHIHADFMRRDFSGTALIIYQKTPLVIHKLGMLIGGQERLLQILKQFYAEVYRQEKCSFPLLKEVFLSNGVTEEQWNSFVYYLSHNY